MRILFLINRLGRGGAQRLMLDVCRELNVRSGIEYRLVGFEPINDFPEYGDDVPYEWCDARVRLSVLGSDEISVAPLQEIIDRFRPDVIHSNLFIPEIVSRNCVSKGARWFTHCHDNMTQFRRFSLSDLFHKQRLAELYERNHMVCRYRERGNTFIAISPDTEGFFKKNLPSDLAQCLHLLPNAIDFTRFSKSTATAPSSGRIRLINVGSFVPKKNQQFLLNAIQQLVRMGVDASLTLVGAKGWLLADVKEKTSALGLSDRVEFAGTVTDVERVLWGSHVFVHSATYEPFGLVLLEAMSAGLPVVALDGSGNRELHRDGFNGFLVPNQDPKEFAARVLDCVKDTQTWNTMSANAREFAKGYDIKNYVDRLLHLYEHGTFDNLQTP